MPSSTPRSSSAEDSCPAPAASAVQTAPASTAHVPASTADYRHVELALLGLSCANCANHVQRTLNKLEGVECMVNFATESASPGSSRQLQCPGSHRGGEGGRLRRPASL
ncbi:MAG: cation transporter [Lawsonella clevelandensis]